MRIVLLWRLFSFYNLRHVNLCSFTAATVGGAAPLVGCPVGFNVKTARRFLWNLAFIVDIMHTSSLGSSIVFIDQK